MSEHVITSDNLHLSEPSQTLIGTVQLIAPVSKTTAEPAFFVQKHRGEQSPGLSQRSARRHYHGSILSIAPLLAGDQLCGNLY